MGNRSTLIRILAMAAGLWALAAPARADLRSEGAAARLQHLQAAPENRREDRLLLAALPADERQQIRQQMRDQWRQSPPEYRERREERREEPRDRWQQMPSDDRQRLREDLREQRGGWGGRRFERRR